MANKLHIYEDESGKININAEVPIFTKKKKRHYVAYCPDFRVFGFSKKSYSDAKKDLDESIAIFLTVHLNRGTLDKTLENFGWEKTDDSYTVASKRGNLPPYLIGNPTSHKVNVPAAAC